VQLLHQDDTRRFISLHLQRPYRFESPFANEEFALLLLACDTQIAHEEQQLLSAAFVAQGCRYALLAGHECSSWDDSIDEAFILRYYPDDCPGSQFIMTDWCEGEPLDEVAFSLLHCTSFDDFVPTRFLVACLGGTPDDATSLNDAALDAIHDA